MSDSTDLVSEAKIPFDSQISKNVFKILRCETVENELFENNSDETQDEIENCYTKGSLRLSPEFTERIPVVSSLCHRKESPITIDFSRITSSNRHKLLRLMKLKQFLPKLMLKKVL